MKVKEESEKTGLKLNIQKTKIKACHPITLCQTDGKINGNSDRLYFPGSKISADGDCSLGRKVMTNLDNILKSRDITLPTRVV